jgi:hypothetical protein
MKLAVVVLENVCSWQSEAIARIASLNNVELTLFKIANSEGEENEGLSGLLYRLYDNLDNRFFSVDPVALAEDSSFPPTPEIFQTIAVDHKDGLLLDYEDRLKESEIDLVVNLTSLNLGRQHFMSETSLGILELQFGLKKRSVSCPPGFWEVMKGSDAMQLLIFLKKNNGDRIKIYDGSSIVIYSSVSRTNNVFFWKIPGVLEREVKKLSAPAGVYDVSSEHNYKTRNFEKTELGFPNSLQIMKFLSIMMLRNLNKSISGRLKNKQWILLFDLKKGVLLGNEFKSFSRITPPKDRYWADPFVYSRNGKYDIFIEEVRFSDKKGFISVMELDKEGRLQKPRKIIEEDFHLSYPFLIEVKGELYMIPESSEKKEIRIYKCVEYPFEWRFEKTIMRDVIAVDSTIVFHKGLYWMFTNIASHEATSTYDELYLFYSEDIFSENWMSHPKNPIVTDVKNARPAGNLFFEDGKLYRPSQNCSIKYGYGMQINEVVEMSKTQYKEKIVESIYPDWDKDLLATHTINSKSGLTVIDALIPRKI